MMSAPLPWIQLLRHCYLVGVRQTECERVLGMVERGVVMERVLGMVESGVVMERVLGMVERGVVIRSRDVAVLE
jgi:hypothetical protein